MRSFSVGGSIYIIILYILESTYVNPKFSILLFSSFLYNPSNLMPISLSILSTTLFLMEPNDAIKFVNKIDDVEAIIYVNEDKILKSKGFNKYEQK